MPPGQAFCQGTGHTGNAFGHLLIWLAMRSMVARSVPLTLTPMGLLTPMASMSMRLQIGGIQMLDSPGTG